MRRTYSLTLIAVAFGLAACSSHDTTTGPGGSTSFTVSPCSAAGTVQLAAAQAMRVDCSNGGTTVTLAGGGASYLIVAQFAVDKVPNALVGYHVSSGNTVTASLVPVSVGPSLLRTTATSAALSKSLPPIHPRARQLAFDRMLRGRAKQSVSSGRWSMLRSLSRSLSAGQSISRQTDPAVGSVRAFQVLANDAGTAYTTVGARLAYAGSDVLVYVDTLSPANGFTDTQLQAYGKLFDQTLYPLDTAAFGPPSDVDTNGHVIMLMTPAVNRLTSSSVCQTQGYVAGFFDEEDLGAPSSDPNSNQGEIFYSIVPDPNGTTSCPHSTGDIDFDVPGTFMHELQHLISYSQHVVVHGGNSEYGWVDEGLSIVAEELGSLYYENKCPGTACRSDPSQLFPDSSQGFIANFLYDSYQYALLPDTASITLHDDSEDGFSWRGGDWLLMRYLGDQLGTGIYRKLDQTTLTGVANIESATGQSFPVLFANFGLALYTDSLPGLPRTTAPSADRFTTRNVRQLWFRLYQTSGGASDVPLPFPLQLFAATSDTATAVMDPGTGSYFRLDTPTGSSSVTIQFAAPGGTALPSSLKPQMAIFRLPPGQ